MIKEVQKAVPDILISDPDIKEIIETVYREFKQEMKEI